jgi:hypothetical protein
MLLGDPEAWLQHFRTLGERVLFAIDEAWPTCLAPLTPIKGALTHEDPITEQLVLALIRSNEVPGRFIPQYSLLTEREDGRAHLSSDIDFVLTMGDDENVYLACECKRLNVPFKSGKKALVRGYLDEGLARFLTGKYSPGLPYALMLGYVMDGNVSSARRALLRALRIRASELQLSSLSVSADDEPFASRHGRADDCRMEVTHRLLPWP